MDTHKGHHLGHPNDRKKRERNLRRTERQRLDNLTAAKKTIITKKIANPITQPIIKSKKRGKRGTKSGLVFRPKELR